MENEKFKIKNGILTEYTGNDEIIEIPNTVSVIGEGVFRKKIAEKIIIPNSVKIIEKDAFRECDIGNIIMNDGVVIIGEYAFCHAHCNTITFSKNLREIQANAFYFFRFYHLEIQKIELPEGIIKIGDNAFDDCEWLVTLPSSVREIGKGAFSWCTSLKRVNIITNEGILNIETDAFSDSGLEELYICNTNYLNIQYRAFGNLPNLKKIKIIGTEYSNININSNAFENCSRLEEINIVTKGRVNIDSSAFENCNELEEINIVAKGIDVGNYAFKNCTMLKRLNLQAEVLGTSIGKHAFLNCSLLHTVNILPNVTTYIYENAFEGCSCLENINCGNLIFLKKDIPLFRCTHEEVMNIIKAPEEIQFSLKNREKVNYYESRNSYEKNKSNEEELKRNEQVQEILEKLDEINKSINESSKDKGYSSASLDYNTIESIVEGIWDIL